LGGGQPSADGANRPPVRPASSAPSVNGWEGLGSSGANRHTRIAKLVPYSGTQAAEERLAHGYATLIWRRSIGGSCPLHTVAVFRSASDPGRDRNQPAARASQGDGTPAFV